MIEIIRDTRSPITYHIVRDCEHQTKFDVLGKYNPTIILAHALEYCDKRYWQGGRITINPMGNPILTIERTLPPNSYRVYHGRDTAKLFAVMPKHSHDPIHILATAMFSASKLPWYSAAINLRLS